jgi:hypothetical protein
MNHKTLILQICTLRGLRILGRIDKKNFASVIKLLTMYQLYKLLNVELEDSALPRKN